VPGWRLLEIQAMDSRLQATHATQRLIRGHGAGIAVIMDGAYNPSGTPPAAATPTSATPLTPPTTASTPH